VVGRKNWQMCNPDSLVDDLHILVEKAGLDLDKVFIINKQTAGTKWFKQAVDSGDWKSIWTYLDETELDVDVTARLDSSNYESNQLICTETAEVLSGMISDKKSVMLKIIAIATAKNYNENIALADALKGLEMWERIIGDTKGTVDFAAAAEMMNNQYPFLMKHYRNVLNCGTHGENDTCIANLARYINAMDLYVELTETSVPETESVAA